MKFHCPWTQFRNWKQTIAKRLLRSVHLELTYSQCTFPRLQHLLFFDANEPIIRLEMDAYFAFLPLFDPVPEQSHVCNHDLGQSRVPITRHVSKRRLQPRRVGGRFVRKPLSLSLSVCVSKDAGVSSQEKCSKRPASSILADNIARTNEFARDIREFRLSTLNPSRFVSIPRHSFADSACHTHLTRPFLLVSHDLYKFREEINKPRYEYDS